MRNIMEKIRVMIVGYGNVGRGVVESVKRNPDMVLAGIVSRSPERVKQTVKDVPVLSVNEPEGWLKELRPDVAILCGGSKDRKSVV